MKNRKFTIEGKTDQSGQFKVTRKQEYLAYFRDWPNCRAVLTVTILPEGASQRALARYFHHIVPRFQTAFKEEMGEFYTLKQTDLELRRMSPVCIEEVIADDDITFGRIKEVRELNSSELSEFLDHLDIIAAQNFNLCL